jgi:hypothetical protein
MTPYVLNATAYAYYVEIKCTKYVEGVGYRDVTDFIYTNPIGGWVYLDFEGDECLYTAFLESMVYKNIEVYRKLAKLYLDNISKKNRIAAMNAMSILDPTFTPPYINGNAAWQRSLMDNVLDATYEVIATSRNEYRLKKYASVLKLLQ